MITYELINPSDDYTFKANSKEAAALSVFLLGSAYGAKCNNSNNDIPILLFSDPEEWYKDEFGRCSEEGIYELWEDVAACLDSFVLGGFRDREIYNTAMSAICEEEKRKEFVDKWNDKRTSCNNIGEYVKYIAKKIRAKYQSVGGE